MLCNFFRKFNIFLKKISNFRVGFDKVYERGNEESVDTWLMGKIPGTLGHGDLFAELPLFDGTNSSD